MQFRQSLGVRRVRPSAPCPLEVGVLVQLPEFSHLDHNISNNSTPLPHIEMHPGSTANSTVHSRVGDCRHFLVVPYRPYYQFHMWSPSVAQYQQSEQAYVTMTHLHHTQLQALVSQMRGMRRVLLFDEAHGQLGPDVLKRTRHAQSQKSPKAPIRIISS